MSKKLHIITIAGIISILSSCRYAKHVPEGKTMLWENDIHTTNNEKIPPGASNILKQRRTKHFWIFAPDLGIYNWGNGTDTSFWSKLGEPPVIFDSAKAETGAKQLTDFFFNHGYFNAFGTFNVHTNEKLKRTYVDYYINPGTQYFIKNYRTDIAISDMHSLAAYFNSESLIKEGRPYDADLLDQERERLAQMYRNHGYYNFSKSFITFEADTFLTGDSVNVKMILSRKPVQRKDSTYYTDYPKYHIKDIYVRPDQSYLGSDSISDSLQFKGYHIIYDSLLYKPRYLTDAIHFRENELYQQSKVKETYSHYISYDAFKFTEIVFREAGRDSSGPLLNAYIRTSPMTKRTFSTESEATTTSGNFGIRLGFNWINRNVFKAGEELRLKLNSGIEFQAALSQDNRRSRTFELGGEVSMNFPRFLLPFNTVGLIPKRMRPSSRITLYASRMSRIEFDREIFGARLSYNWKESELKRHQIDIFDFSYSRLVNIDSIFRSNLNEIQQIAFQSALISATKYTYTYNEQLDPDRKNHNFFKSSVEFAGNILSAVESTTGFGEISENNVRTIGAVPYFQYFKIDVDYRFYWNFSKNTSWAHRFFAATIRPYGNSIIRTESGDLVRNPPFTKYLYMGGSNDLRAWPAYRLGAGIEPNTNYFPRRLNTQTNKLEYDPVLNHDTSFALGTIKLLYSTELRFPIFSFFKGALFADMGNIWLNGDLENEQTDFKLEDFYKQLAIGGGFGLRMDFDFFLIRLDVAAKVRDPGMISQGMSPWVIDNYPFRNLTYNIALGYPF